MADENTKQGEQHQSDNKVPSGQNGAKVTREAVFAAAEVITEAGQTATVERIRTHLGGGSPNDVLRFQRDWKVDRAKRGAQEPPKSDKPEEKKPAAQRVVSLQDVPEVAQAIEQIRNAVGGVELAVLNAMVGVQQRGEDAAASQVRALQESHARAIAQLCAEMQQVRDAAQASVEKAEAERDEEVAGYTKMMAETEAAANEKVATANALVEQTKATLAKTEEERARLELALTKAAASVQQMEMVTIPELRQDLARAVAAGAVLKDERDALQQQLGAMKAEAAQVPGLVSQRDSLRQQLHDLQVSSTEKITAAQGKVATGQALVDELRTDRDQARARSDRLDRRVALLESALMRYPSGVQALQEIPSVEDDDDGVANAPQDQQQEEKDASPEL